MRHVLMLLACLAPAPLAAQTSTVAVSQGDFAATCQQETSAARRAHDEAERARLAADPGARPRLFFHVCDGSAIPAITAPTAGPAAPAAPTCATLRTAARAEHDARERARIAAHDDGVRYAFYFDCPLAEAQPVTSWGQSDPATGQNSFGFGQDPLAPQDPRPIRTATTTERCTGNLLDQTCELRTTANAGRSGEVQSERRCRQDGLTRSCESSGTVTFGNSEEGRNAARDALDRMLDDDDD